MTSETAHSAEQGGVTMSHDTVELPADLMPGEPVGDPRQEKKRKPRWWLRGGIALVVLALLAGGAELALRAIIPNVVASTLREQLGLPTDHPVDVDLEGSALLPALTGHLGPTTVTVPHAIVFDGIDATLRASAQWVPFNPSRGSIEGAEVSVTIPSNSMNQIVSLVTRGLADSGEIRDGELIVGRSIELFGVSVTLQASLKASVEDGDLLIEPTGVNAVGFDLTADQLRSLLGETASNVLDVHTVCVRDQMPAGVTLTSLTLSQTVLGVPSATVTAKLDPDILSNPSKQQSGRCADKASSSKAAEQG